jgi:peptide deformylase
MGEKRPIVKEPNQILRKKAAEVPVAEIKSLSIQRLISDMKETLRQTPDGVGLAAPQVGESLQIFIVSEEAEEIDRTRWERERDSEKPYEKRLWKYYVFINPRVKKISRKKIEDGEGCLSVPGKYGTVKRHEKITVEAYDEAGKKFTRGASKFFARVLQHEIDHLDGTLFIDKAEKIFDSARGQASSG